MYDIALLNGTLCDGHSTYRANLYVQGEKIAAITPPEIEYESASSMDCSGLFIVPGFVDPHVHLGLRLGKYTSSDDFSSGSDAALSGGVTTFFDFIDPVSRLSDLERVLNERLDFATNSKIDYGFHLTLGGDPDFDPEEISGLALKNGLPSIKIFTTYSSSKRKTTDGYLYSLLKSSRVLGTVVMAHCENDEIIDFMEKETPSPTYRNLSELRPTVSETEAVYRAVLLSMMVDGQLYVVHVSSGITVDYLSEQPRDWRKNAVLETCPQYLSMGDGLLKNDDGYLYTFCPPLRADSERRLLDGMLRKGWISTIGTDHCPFKITEKEESRNDYFKMPNGIASLGLAFSIVNTVTKDLPLLVRMMSENPARLMGIYPDKGSLIPGTDADIAIVALEEEFVVDRPGWGKAEYYPYSGMKFKGCVKGTIIRGHFCFRDGKILLADGHGKFIPRGPIKWGDSL